MGFNIKSPQQVSARRGLIVTCNATAAAAFSSVAISSLGEHAHRDPFYVFIWFVWMLITLIWVFGMPGYLRWSRAERSVLNDELVKAHQSVAARAGLTLALASLSILCLGSFLRVPLPLWTPPALTSVTVVLTALRFAWLEHRDA